MPAERNSASLFALGTAAVLAAVLAGCGQYYWFKAGISPADFYHDSQECARQSALATTTAVGVGVDDGLYRRCLRDRGYLRGQQSTPPPPDWYRGIE